MPVEFTLAFGNMVAKNAVNGIEATCASALPKNQQIFGNPERTSNEYVRRICGASYPARFAKPAAGREFWWYKIKNSYLKSGWEFLFSISFH